MITDLLCFPGNKVECRNNSKTQVQEMSWDPRAQADLGRNLADKKINWKVLILKMLIDLSVCYFNPLALYTVKPPGANICLIQTWPFIASLIFPFSVKRNQLTKWNQYSSFSHLWEIGTKYISALGRKGDNPLCCQIKKFRIQMQVHSRPK